MNSRLSSYQSDKHNKCCDGRVCDQKPIKYCRIKYIKKIGCFCDKCASDLLESALAEDMVESSSSHSSFEVV